MLDLVHFAKRAKVFLLEDYKPTAHRHKAASCLEELAILLAKCELTEEATRNYQHRSQVETDATPMPKLAELEHQPHFPAVARTIVFDYVKQHLEKTDTHVTFGLDEVYIVWFSKTLQNWKALLSTTLPDGMYYEVTFNGDKNEAYLDAYKKFDNKLVHF